MRDILVVFLLIGGIGLTLKRAWLGVLVLAFFGYANPHRYAWGFSTDLPVYQILLIAALIAFLQEKEKQNPPRDWRIPLFYLLWTWFAVTSLASPIPNVAWGKFWDVSKVYLPLFLTLMLITDRRKLFWLLTTIGFSFGLLAAKGGIFAIRKGFVHRVWGPDGTMYGGNNEFSIATLVAIPLLLLTWLELRRDTGWRRALAYAALMIVPLAFSSVVSSWSRGGLIAMAALYAFIWWKSRHKILVAALGALIVLQAPKFLPDELMSRWQTIETYEEDNSAMNRIETWRHGIAYALQHPILGAGFDGWRYVSYRDWHSSYVEILAEHGFPGAMLWALLVFGTLFNLARLARLGRRTGDISLRNHAVMLQASIIAYAAGSVTLGITYWDLIYQLVFCAVLLKHFAAQSLTAHAAQTCPASPNTGLPETRRI